MFAFHEHVRQTLAERLERLEGHLQADGMFFYGPIYPGVEKRFRDFLERLKAEPPNRDRLVIFLNTSGGSAETVETLVEIIRFNYSEVLFVVPDYAMSAGTIFCMSGDRILMDYSSSLGPIDPQVHNGRDWVPALGYLDQVEQMIQKSIAGQLSDAELIMLQSQDLAMLSRYEQAKNLTITLLKKWLVEYKFRNWTTHHASSAKRGQPVTEPEKQERAEEIARMLADNKLWHSHGRRIGIGTLQNVLRLKIDDYSADVELRNQIRSYNDFLIEFIIRENHPSFLHSRSYF
jgi:hypothetical protein